MYVFMCVYIHMYLCVFIYVCMGVYVLSHIQLFEAPWTIACQPPLSIDSPGKNTRMGCHFLIQELFPTQGSNLRLLHWQADSLPLSHLGSPDILHIVVQSLSRVHSLIPHGLQHARLPLSFCISLSLLKRMSIESVIPFNHLILCCPFSSCLQSFPASGSFPRSQLFASGGQSIGASSSASIFSMNIQSLFFFKIDKDIFISSWDIFISLILLVNILLVHSTIS